MFVYEKTQTLHYKEQADFPAVFLKRMQEQRLKEHLCDVKLLVGDDCVEAHRVVLCAQSAYFEAMFTRNFQECQQDTIDLSESFSSSATLSALIDYMYTGEIKISGEILPEILGGASLFLIERVKKHCAQYMLANLSPLNCIQMWMLADFFSINSVTVLCKLMARARFHDLISCRPEILEISHTYMENLIKEGILDWLMPDEVAKLLLHWLEYQPVERGSHSLSLLNSAQLLTEELQSDAAMEELVSNIILDDEEDGEHKENSRDAQPGCAYDTEAQEVSPSDAIETLKSMVSKLETQRKARDETFSAVKTEHVIVGTFTPSELVSAHSEERRQVYVQVHFYRPRVNQWSVKDLFLPSHVSVSTFVGTTGGNLVFKVFGGQGGVLLYDTYTQVFHAVGDPQRTEDTFCPRAYLCFNNTVLCFMDNNMFNFIPMIHPVQAGRTRRIMVLDMITWTWKEVGQVPSGIMEYVSRELNGVLYVYSCRYVEGNPVVQIQPHWFSIRGSVSSYFVTELAQPITHDDLTEPTYGRLSDFCGGELDVIDGGKALVLSKETIPEEHVYDIEADTWTARVKAIKRPPGNSMYVRGAMKEFSKVHVGSDRVSASNILVGYPRSASIYHLELVCPYITRFWGYFKEQDNWVEFTPPSTDRLEHLVSCEVASSLFAGDKESYYPDKSEERGQSPMAHCRLPDHLRHVESSEPLIEPHVFDPYIPYFDDRCSDFSNEKDPDDTDDTDDILRDLFPF